MVPFHRWTKSLTARPEPQVPAGLEVRTARYPDDVPAWLRLRHAAWAEHQPGGRPWTAADFEREFVAKPWWSPERIWLATCPGRDRPEVRDIVGAVALGRSGLRQHDAPCVLWLMVDPAHRRRGVGGLLLATLECQVWDDGERCVTLETHDRWRDAIRLYERHGYQRR